MPDTISVPKVTIGGRKTQKTQHGIETVRQYGFELPADAVARLRKPSTGLKHGFGAYLRYARWRRKTQKTQHGIETLEG